MKKLLLTILILTTFSLIKAQMISHWTFSEMSGTILNDHSGNNNNGQIYGATWQQTNGLRFLLFNGSNNYVSVQNSSIYNLGTSDFTVEAQFKTSVVPTGSWVALVSKHNTANWHDREFNLSIEGGTGLPYFSLSDGTGYFETVKGITNVCDGLFHIVRGVRQSGQIKIYVDGNLEGTTSATINVTNSNAINIGRSSYDNGYGYFNGVISQISLWNTAISNEISHWTFSEMSGTILNDHSGNNNNGQIYGVTWQQVNGLRCLSFDGSGNYVSVPHNSKFNIGKGDFTIQAQFRTSVIPTGSFSCIFSKHNTANWYDTDFCLLIEGGTGKPFMQLCDGTSNIPSNIENCYATTNVCDGKFHTVQVVRKDGQIKIYVDGNLEGSLASQINPDSSNPVNIGRTSYNNGYGYFNGVISDISFWNSSNPITLASDDYVLNNIMNGMKIVERIKKTTFNATVNQDAMVNAGYQNCQKIGDFVIYTKNAQALDPNDWTLENNTAFTGDKMPANVNVKFAWKSDGTVYMGASGPDNEILSTIIGGWGSPYVDNQFRGNFLESWALKTEYSNFNNRSFLSSNIVLDSLSNFTTLDTKIFNRFPKKIFRITSSVYLLAQPATVSQLMRTWSPFSSLGAGTASRTFNLNYSGAINSHVLSMASNDNGNSSYVKLDGIIVAQKSKWTDDYNRKNGTYPSAIEMGTTIVWSVGAPRFNMALVCDTVWSSNCNQNPVGGFSNNRSPIISSIPTYNSTTAVNYDESTIPAGYLLSQNFPNPFNPTTTIKFSISKSQFVSIKVYDILGKEISTLVNEEKTPSSYEVQFNGSSLASGMYFYRMQAGSFSQTKKLLLIK
ncbi:MAG: T9SS type A sorting domain-containing protein [Bacteroidetes bacterium]|nr:T9SS type A sorting domain-containing protein [Bacteroidota bacterium]